MLKEAKYLPNLIDSELTEIDLFCITQSFKKQIYFSLRIVKGNCIKQKKKILRNNNKWLEKQVTKKANYSQGRIYKTLFFSVAFAKQYRNYEIAKEILKWDNSWNKR